MHPFKQALITSFIVGLAATTCAMADIEFRSEQYKEHPNPKLMHLAQNTITGTTATGQKQTTIIDVNGNLKVMQGGAQTTSPGVNPAPETGGTPKPAMPMDSTSQGPDMPTDQPPSPPVTGQSVSNPVPGQPGVSQTLPTGTAADQMQPTLDQTQTLPSQTPTVNPNQTLPQQNQLTPNQTQTLPQPNQPTLDQTQAIPQQTQPLPPNQPMALPNQPMAQPNQPALQPNQPFPQPNQAAPDQTSPASSQPTPQPSQVTPITTQPTQTTVTPAEPQNAPASSVP